MMHPVAYAGFSKGGGRKFENNEDQKKGLYSDLAHVSAQIWVKTKKKVFTQIQPIFLPKFQKGAWLNFAHYS